MHATSWLGLEKCSNRRRNLVPDESGQTGAGKWNRFMAPVSGASVMGIRPTSVLTGL